MSDHTSKLKRYEAYCYIFILHSDIVNDILHSIVQKRKKQYRERKRMNTMEYECNFTVWRDEMNNIAK